MAMKLMKLLIAGHLDSIMEEFGDKLPDARSIYQFQYERFSSSNPLQFDNVNGDIVFKEKVKLARKKYPNWKIHLIIEEVTVIKRRFDEEREAKHFYWKKINKDIFENGPFPAICAALQSIVRVGEYYNHNEYEEIDCCILVGTSLGVYGIRRLDSSNGKFNDAREISVKGLSNRTKICVINDSHFDFNMFKSVFFPKIDLNDDNEKKDPRRPINVDVDVAKVKDLLKRLTNNGKKMKKILLPRIICKALNFSVRNVPSFWYYLIFFIQSILESLEEKFKSIKIKEVCPESHFMFSFLSKFNKIKELSYKDNEDCEFDFLDIGVGCLDGIVKKDKTLILKFKPDIFIGCICFVQYFQNHRELLKGINTNWINDFDMKLKYGGLSRSESIEKYVIENLWKEKYRTFPVDVTNYFHIESLAEPKIILELHKCFIKSGFKLTSFLIKDEEYENMVYDLRESSVIVYCFANSIKKKDESSV